MGTGSNLDQERTDVCEEVNKCSQYLYIFDHKNTLIVLSQHQKIILYFSIQYNTIQYNTVQ